MTDNFHTKHFNCIQALRGFTALFVALEHVRFLNCGAFGVDIFFIISGFMAMFATHNDTKHFMKKRLIRIYPLYALLTVGTFFLLLIVPGLFHLTEANPIYLVKSLCFIPFEISPGIIQPLVRVGWTINYEMLFYLLFFISFRISHKYRGLICSALLGILVLLLQMLPLESTCLRFYGDFIQLEFVFGILTYYIVRKLYQVCEEKSFTSLLSYLSIPIVLGLFIYLAITKQHTDISGMGRVLYWGLPALIIVLCTFIVNLNITMPKFMIVLGNMSFSIYLLHYYPLMFIDRKIYSFESYSPKGVVFVVCGLLVVILISYISHLLIEKKLTRYLRKFFK